MICPKCGANNPKEPLQCMRCGYIFPEYIDKHNIDMKRKGKEKAEAKRVEAVRKFTPKSVSNPTRTVPNSNRTVTSNVSRVPVRPVGTPVREEQKEVPVVPTKIKKVIYMGRNGVNRFDDIKQCFLVSLIYTAIILVACYVYKNIL